MDGGEKGDGNGKGTDDDGNDRRRVIAICCSGVATVISLFLIMSMIIAGMVLYKDAQFASIASITIIALTLALFVSCIYLYKLLMNLAIGENDNDKDGNGD